MQTSNKITIETPDHFEIEFESAGLGTRSIAFMIDTLIQFGIILSIGVILALLGLALGQAVSVIDAVRGMYRSLGLWLLGLFVLAVGIVNLGYFMLFEYMWNGLTPGKRWMKIRTVRTDGRALSLLDSAIRNILRFVDFLGDVYPIGLAVAFIDGKERRLGDFAAGTFVVQDAIVDRPDFAEPTSHSEEEDPRIRNAVATMTDEDYRLVSRFLERRDGMDKKARIRLARTVHDRIFEDGLKQPDNTDKIEEELQAAARLHRERARIL